MIPRRRGAVNRREPATVRGWESLRMAKRDSRIQACLMPSTLEIRRGQGQNARRGRGLPRSARVIAFLEYGGESEYYRRGSRPRVFLLQTNLD